MITPISDATAYLYKIAVKPVLFKFSPDTVHHRLIGLGRISSDLPPMRWFIKSFYAYQNTAVLSQTIANITYRNPVGLSAGFDKNFELLKILPAVGFGFVEGGSLTFHKSAGNPKPHYRRLPKSKSILVNAGLNNDGVHVIAKRIQNYGDLPIPLNISIAKTNAKSANTDTSGIADYIGSLQIIKQNNVGDILTLNISCPNAFGGEPFTTPERLEALLAKVDALELHQPMYIKMPIDKPWSEFKVLLDIILKHRVTGVTIGNLAKDRNNPHIKDELPRDWPGNMSGKPTHDLSNQLIHQSYKYCGNRLVIVGVGGIFNANDAYEKIKHGASLVELITGLIFEGPQVVGQINKDLADLLKSDGYTNIAEAVGSYHR